MKKLIENRPWGNFVRYSLNEPTTVKIITVNPDQELSLQSHSERKEFWKVLKGHPTITIGEKKIEAKPDDEFEVEQHVLHRIAATTDEVSILEIAFGNFNEEDIVRVEDKYGRT